MKSARQIVEFIIANGYPEAKATTFEEYCLLAGLDDPTDMAREVFQLLSACASIITEHKG